MRAVALKNPSDTELGVEHYVSSHGRCFKLLDRPLQSCFHIPFVVGHFRKPHSSLAIGATRHFFGESNPWLYSGKFDMLWMDDSGGDPSSFGSFSMHGSVGSEMVIAWSVVKSDM